MIRRANRLMPALLAILFAVIAAAGTWGRPLWNPASAYLTWLDLPAKILGVMLWFGVIVLYLYPDGNFTPPWTRWLALLTVPLSILIVFDVDTVLNPTHWPGPLALLPQIVFIGGAWYSAICRYRFASAPDFREQMRWYRLGVSLLMVVFFIDLILNQLIPSITGQALFPTNRSAMFFALVYEPIWYLTALAFGYCFAKTTLAKGQSQPVSLSGVPS